MTRCFGILTALFLATPFTATADSVTVRLVDPYGSTLFQQTSDASTGATFLYHSDPSSQYPLHVRLEVTANSGPSASHFDAWGDISAAVHLDPRIEIIHEMQKLVGPRQYEVSQTASVTTNMSIFTDGTVSHLEPPAPVSTLSIVAFDRASNQFTMNDSAAASFLVPPGGADLTAHYGVRFDSHSPEGSSASFAFTTNIRSTGVSVPAPTPSSAAAGLLLLAGTVVMKVYGRRAHSDRLTV